MKKLARNEKLEEKLVKIMQFFNVSCSSFDMLKNTSQTSSLQDSKKHQCEHLWHSVL